MAERLARSLLTARLAACVNLVPAVRSLYWWQGALDESRETLLVIKTSAAHLDALTSLVQREHPYDCPEVLALPVSAGSADYVSWLRGELR
ncbi:MAG: divalent-cation tolerance protein CutA [Myxococcales bacterium]|nr:MAG: divalent-cation tolerance protein CutA [Myxococcales bacterium]